jgi:peptide/nickel transport system ATP-binding protein
MAAVDAGQDALITAEDLAVAYASRGLSFWRSRAQPFVAVDGVSFTIAPGETLGVVGESGSGKSTIGRVLLGRTPLARGRVLFRGKQISGVRGEEQRRLTRHLQPVFQDPYGSLNPRMTVEEIIAEPLLVHGIARGAEAADRVAALLDLVGLPRDSARRHPGTFSGGQRQRIGIARALAVEPEFIVADEPVSALDVSIRAQIVNLFRDLQDRLGVAYMFIAHDLAVVRHVSHRIAVLYRGRIVELAPRDAIYEQPLHPYTRALLAAVPIPDPKYRRTRLSIAGGDAGWARPFAARGAVAPPLVEKVPGHFVAEWDD